MPVFPSPSQRSAIEAPPGPLLVLAGPGAGKTYCLIERIRFLIEAHGFDPARICAFTFTNKAAGEIAHRLETRIGAAAARVKRGTIHRFCADLLRELGGAVGLEQGFGIADEEYQLSALRRIEGPRRWHRNTLTRFSAHRFRGDPLLHNDLILFEKYERFLADRRLADFDTLVLKAAELLERPDASKTVRERFDVILVDEFQDLNPVQYRVVHALAREHRHVFGVGDNEQSIYSWAGADPKVFTTFVNDFGITTNKISLEENRRCPADVFSLAWKLVTINAPLFGSRTPPRASREPAFPIRAISFGTDADEAAWLIDDLRRDREASGHEWGRVALVYRKHEIGELLETTLLNAGIPCRLAQGRALADDPAIAYVIAAIRVISHPHDDVFAECFFREVLPRVLLDEALAKAEEARIQLRQQLSRMAAELPRGDDNARQIRRALANYRNLTAIGKQHPGIASLVKDLLSRRVGRLPSVLVDREDEIEDPAGMPHVVALAERLRSARNRGAPVWIEPVPGEKTSWSGIDIPLGAILANAGIDAVRGDPPKDAERIHARDLPTTGLALGVFKAAQMLEMTGNDAAFTNFTAIDLETTDNDIRKAEVVEIAAVRVRGGRIVDTFHSLVKPATPITAGAIATHGITNDEVSASPSFAQVWPRFREFCGDDVIVAHNGYEFDFKILYRMSRAAGATFGLCTFDSLPLARDLFNTSRKLGDLAHHFGIDTGRSHRALDDTKALAQVMLKLNEMKLERSRKTALVNLLDQLGVALALSDRESLRDEARMLARLTVPYALARYSDCLQYYEHRQGADESIPNAQDVVDRLGGMALMEKIRAEKTADERYPSAMKRLRSIIDELPDAPLDTQLSIFLERVVLSKYDGTESDLERVNLLTLHSTKGLEFSRVYVVGVEDAQLPGGSPEKGPSAHEIEEARRLLYVGMTRTIDRLVLTRSETRSEKPTGGRRFLDEMGLVAEPATATAGAA
ncbi:MAG TPA: UvrD-helicase domain-containing protein [Gemmatimonadaceae bacterium]|nr:UvrD-helicase domain-containing protein [Gemmatimonadaceae bacterium]